MKNVAIETEASATDESLYKPVLLLKLSFDDAIVKEKDGVSKLVRPQLSRAHGSKTRPKAYKYALGGMLHTSYVSVSIQGSNIHSTVFISDRVNNGRRILRQLKGKYLIWRLEQYQRDRTLS